MWVNENAQNTGRSYFRTSTWPTDYDLAIWLETARRSDFTKKKQPSMAMVLVWQGGIVPLPSVLLLKNSSCVKSWTSNLGLSGFLLNCECEVRQVDVKSPNFDFGIDWILCCIFRIITESLPKQSKVNWILSEQGHASNQTSPIDSSIHGQFYQSFDLVGGFNPIKKYEWN